MKKRAISLLLALVMLVGMLPMGAIASQAGSYVDNEGDCGDNLCWLFYENSGLLVIYGEGSMFDYSMISSPPWVYYSEAILSITIENGATSIGNYAFQFCSNLESVTIANSVTNIGDWAFQNCRSLECVTIPNSVTSIGHGAFEGCNSLRSITIPDSVTSIGDWAFQNCSSLERVTIPNSVTNIGDHTFFMCSSLESAIIPDSVTSIGHAAFEGCYSLRSITIPNSVTSIGNGAFSSCYSLRSITIPNSVTCIGLGAFESCYSLTRVTVPDSVTSIGKWAFCDCNSLTGAYFMGTAPALDSNVFDVYDVETGNYQPIPGLTLYYIEGKEGWTSPTWNGYPTATWVPSNGFNDVSYGAWYADAVDYAVRNGLMNGVGDSKFEPETAMSRAMLVTVLWRYAGEPMEGENSFVDVPDGQWYTNAVAWAANNGIVGGVGNNKFDPNGNITREQMSAILYRYCNSLGIDTTKRADLSTFPDGNKVSRWASDALSWANAEGLISGTKIGNNTYLDPQGNATRAQVATILMRFIENLIG